MSKKIKVVLADDHRLLRAGLKMLLEATGEIEVVGEGADGLEALRVLETVAADVAVIDLTMPHMDGMACIKEIKSRGLDVNIVVLTMHEDEHYVKETMKAGALAYVPKGSADVELFKAIKTVHTNRRYLSQQDTQTLLSLLLKEEATPADSTACDPYKVLSTREREVLKFLAYGYTSGEIAAQLFVSIKTVDTYKARIMEKLGFNHKREIVSYALKYNLLS